MESVFNVRLTHVDWRVSIHLQSAKGARLELSVAAEITLHEPGHAESRQDLGVQARCPSQAAVSGKAIDLAP